MDKKIKQEWLAELRSGKYTQGKGRLCDSKGALCCLGVLCVVAERHGVGRWRDTPSGKAFGCCDNAEEVRPLHAGLPFEVQGWSGLTYAGKLPRAVMCDNGRSWDSLVNLNDVGMLNFDQIADVIEEQL